MESLTLQSKACVDRGSEVSALYFRIRRAIVHGKEASEIWKKNESNAIRAVLLGALKCGDISEKEFNDLMEFLDALTTTDQEAYLRSVLAHAPDLLSEDESRLAYLHDTFRRENETDRVCTHLIQLDARDQYRAVCTKNPPGYQCTRKCPAYPQAVPVGSSENAELAVA